MNAQLDAGYAEDWERPAHVNQSALVLDRAPALSGPLIHGSNPTEGYKQNQVLPAHLKVKSSHVGSHSHGPVGPSFLRCDLPLW